ncbi:DUF3231 family protein [Aneurinibacillus tyrosinisolvens]|uniref:DUF3231 family protein n=1 Tax=Aneurinibacillus tyrosinisolvens TaxID=1443435 RepID=UPI00063F4CC4|nr:DUF3231 family protein [Aneurinibacillus tyrosinisolvens]
MKTEAKHHTHHETKHNTKLTSAEIANLWSTYQSDSMGRCVLSYFLEKVEDTEIRPVLEYTRSNCEKHIKMVTEIFHHEKYPIPHGFTNEDVHVDAPRLYSDVFFLYYVKQMARMGLVACSLALPMSARSDVRDFYNECLSSSAELENKVTKIQLSKGLLVRPPYISTPKEVDFVEKQSFLQGFFGDQRPLNAIEITHLFGNIQKNTLGKALLIGFAQVARTKEVREYMLRGKEIAMKHIEVFSSTLRDEDLPAPMPWDDLVTDSTMPPFSDKLMMAHTNALNSAGIGNYGAAIGMSMRTDLSTNYVRLTAEIMKYAEDGANIMIDNAWLEQPPQTVNRDALTNL